MNIDTWLSKFTATNILVVGDAMLDHYVWGDVQRISPEAPVPIVNVQSETWTAGGAANVALNLANLGVQTSVLSFFNNDDAGTRLQKILSAQGVRIIQNPSKAATPTIIKTRVIVRNQQLCRIDREDEPEAYRIDNTDGFYYFLEKALAQANAVIVSDYAKGVINQILVDYLVKLANTRKELLVAIDPKPSNNLSFLGAGLLTPNYSEALQLAGFEPVSYKKKYSLEAICDSIYEKHAPKMLVITLGAEGMAICNNGKLVEVLPTEAREVFDVSGAGDTVIATLTAALAAGSSLEEAARLANAAAGCVVAHMGTVPIKLTELEASLATKGR